MIRIKQLLDELKEKVRQRSFQEEALEALFGKMSFGWGKGPLA